MNNCTIYGHLGQDPEVKQTQSGTPLLTFSLANVTGFSDKKQTNWFSCVAFGERWEKVAQYLQKGSAVVVSGEVTLHTYNEKSRLQLNVNQISFAGGKKEEAPKEKPKLNNDGMPNW